MAFKFSLEINKNKITQKSLIAFLKILYNISKIKKKKVTFQPYSRLLLDGPKIAVCETTSNVVFVLNSPFTSKDYYFRAAIEEAMNAYKTLAILRLLGIMIQTYIRLILLRKITYFSNCSIISLTSNNSSNTSLLHLLIFL